MRRSGFSRTIGLVASAIVVIGFLAYLALQPSVAWPSESRRIVHPAGFSIVKPPAWDSFLTYSDGTGDDLIRMVPANAVGAAGSMSALRIKIPVTPENLASRGYTPTTFDGKPAFEKLKSSEKAKDHMRSLIFERDGQWFEITIKRPELDALDSGVWLAYAQSLRIEPIRKFPTTLSIMTAPNATQPANPPAVPPATGPAS